MEWVGQGQDLGVYAYILLRTELPKMRNTPQPLELEHSSDDSDSEDDPNPYDYDNSSHPDSSFTAETDDLEHLSLALVTPLPL